MKRESPDLLLRVSGAFLVSLMVCLLVSTGSQGEQGNSVEKQQLNTLISGYFSSWSKPDMEAYKSCFHPKASIYFIDGSGNPHHSLLEEFIARQEKAHQSARERLSERPTQTSVVVQGRIAHAAVRWELQKGGASVTGTDYFTFIKKDGGWKILSLIYEQDQK